MNTSAYAYLRTLSRGWLGGISTAVTALTTIGWLANIGDVFRLLPTTWWGVGAMLSFFVANLNYYRKSQIFYPASLPEPRPSEKETDAGFTIDGQWWMRDWPHHDDSAERKKRTFSNNAVLKQNGTTISGRFTNSDGSYEIDGEIRGSRIFVGQWREIIGSGPPRPIWYGYFMFRIVYHRDEPTMLGRWIGITGDQEHVGSGIWEWCKPGKKFPTE